MDNRQNGIGVLHSLWCYFGGELREEELEGSFTDVPEIEEAVDNIGADITMSRVRKDDEEIYYIAFSSRSLDSGPFLTLYDSGEDRKARGVHIPLETPVTITLSAESAPLKANEADLIGQIFQRLTYFMMVQLED